MTIKGPDVIDVSHHSGLINWAIFKENHPEIKAVFIRCSEGYFLRGINDPLTFKDYQFDNNWKGVKGIGLHRSPYMYGRVDWDNPRFNTKRPNMNQQVDNLLEWSQPNADDGEYIILDFEQPFDQWNYYLSYVEVRTRIITGLTYAITQHPLVMLYTGGWWWNKIFPVGFKSSFIDLNTIPLWNSVYYNWNIINNKLLVNRSPGKVNGFDKVTWHQYGTTGRFKGIDAATDLNRYLGDGTIDEFFKQPSPPEPPDPPEPPQPPPTNVIELASGEQITIKAK